MEKFPAKFPASREFGSGDGFDPGCIHHHAVLHSWRFPEGVRNASNWRGSYAAAWSLRPLICGRATSWRFFLWARNPVSRQRRPLSSETRSNGELLRWKSEHLVLAGPFSRQVGETGNSHAAWESSMDGGLDEVGREKGERDCHVHLPHAAALTFGDAFSICSRIGNEFVEPTAPPCDRCNQDRATLGTDGAGVLRRCGFRHENFTTSG